MFGLFPWKLNTIEIPEHAKYIVNILGYITVKSTCDLPLDNIVGDGQSLEFIYFLQF